MLGLFVTKKSWRKINERFVRKFHSERKPNSLCRSGLIARAWAVGAWFITFRFNICFYDSCMKWLVGVIMVVCSGWGGTWWITPLRWRMVAGCVFWVRRNVMNHALTAGAWWLVAGICRTGVGIYELNLAEVFCPKFYSCEGRWAFFHNKKAVFTLRIQILFVILQHSVEWGAPKRVPHFRYISTYN